MTFFKSSKNNTTSAATTPAQTPRPSLDASRPATAAGAQPSKMTKEQALEMAMQKVVGNTAMRGNIRI
ncbi:hypothetical protein EMPS_05908 [Entomortierella parvispora]|uniref:Uncharacterized protein n=1 Tax=Entomortierella parvispora TaxID=205924 RepID=A0A9P3HBL9_9FUNG|nr:hypothetical protein EMPS_05908 [Entomortierella parvispora]